MTLHRPTSRLIALLLSLWFAFSSLYWGPVWAEEGLSQSGGEMIE